MEPHTDFDYDAIDGVEQIDLSGELATLLDWIAEPRQDRARVVRLQAVRIHFTGKSQVQMAREVGTTKAALGKVITMFMRRFGVNAPGARDAQLREKLSYICKARHNQ